MLKEGTRIGMVENCKDNQNIIRGQKGTIRFINYDGSIEVEFDHLVTGYGIYGNGMNDYFWYVTKEQITEVI